MKSFYDMMRLVENYPGAPEDFGDSPAPEEDAAGMDQAEFEQGPMGEMGAMAADFPALAKAAEADPAVAEELKRLFSMMGEEPEAPPEQGMDQSQMGQPPMGQPPVPPTGGAPFMRK